jgi:hypothetical protein
MSRYLALALVCALTLPAAAEEARAAAEPVPFAPVEATEVTLEQFQWEKRPVVVFADSPADPNFVRQMELLMARPEVLVLRDVVVIVDTDPATPSAVRRALRPRGFSLVLLGKDGRVIQRKPAPWDVREITRAIDRTPQGQQEIQDRLRGGGSAG